MRRAIVTPRHLVIAGAGHAHLDLLASLARAPLPGWTVSLVVPQPDFQYSGMLPAVIAGHVPPAAASIPVARIARRAGLEVHLDAVSALDTAARTVTLASGQIVGYDLLSLDVGSIAAAQSVPGVARFAFPVRPFTQALSLLARLDEAVGGTASGAAVPAVVVGAGAAGVEIACAMRARIRAAGALPSITIVDATAADGLPLAGFAPAMRARTAQALASRGIGVVQGQVTSVSDAAVTLESAAGHVLLPSICTAWVTGAAAHPWLAASGLRSDARGFPLAAGSLALSGDASIFGGGDCVTLEAFPQTPKAGVYAVRMAPVLAANIRARATGAGALRTYRPQSDFLALLSTSDGQALLRYRGVALEAAWAQRLKDRIDHRYLERYRSLAG